MAGLALTQFKQSKLRHRLQPVYRSLLFTLGFPHLAATVAVIVMVIVIVVVTVTVTGTVTVTVTGTILV